VVTSTVITQPLITPVMQHPFLEHAKKCPAKSGADTALWVEPFVQTSGPLESATHQARAGNQAGSEQAQRARFRSSDHAQLRRSAHSMHNALGELSLGRPIILRSSPRHGASVVELPGQVSGQLVLQNSASLSHKSPSDVSDK